MTATEPDHSLFENESQEKNKFLRALNALICLALGDEGPMGAVGATNQCKDSKIQMRKSSHGPTLSAFPLCKTKYMGF
jgi:hypothetical protein